MPEDKQNYFNIGKLTEQFRAVLADLPDDEIRSVSRELMIWSVMTRLACAQQLSVIAGSLKKIEKAWNQNPEPQGWESAGKANGQVSSETDWEMEI